MSGKIVATLSTFLMLLFVVLFWAVDGWREKPPIRVGILHSLTGTMAFSEKAVVDTVQMAIDELNANGGVLGRTILPVVADAKSDWPTSAREAERLITEEKVSVIFGCWTSACRKTVKPVIEKYNHLLIYPVQYEGLETSPNIIYTGAAPNQQIIPAVDWSFKQLGKRFFLVGSDYVFPRTANAIIKDRLQILGGELVGESYVLLGDTHLQKVAAEIARTAPDVVLNTINGDSNIALFEELQRLNVTAKTVPVISFSIGESELQSMPQQMTAGHYAAWNYFQSIQSPENQSFVQRFRDKYGSNRVINDPMEAGYFGVMLWAQAVAEIETDAVNEVNAAIKNQLTRAPEGPVFINARTRHSWKTVRIGRIRPDGQFDIVWNSDRPVRPVPYPKTRTVQEWEQFLLGLYNGWGQQWANSGK
ncbi:MAG: urea ABC transporter substrate-binding protein [Magnetococcales bacterium]|nr:urea ABC transporter substrate-binding protein [Magnetococcales bacterium]